MQSFVMHESPDKNRRKTRKEFHHDRKEERSFRLEKDMDYYHDTRLMRKVTMDYESARTKRLKTGKSFEFKHIPVIVTQEIRHWLHFD